MEEEFRTTAGFRECMNIYIHSFFFSTFIFVAIIINTGLLVLQTFEFIAVRSDWYFTIVDNVFVGIYIMECILKIYVLRLQFFKDYWNILDLLLVLANVISIILPLMIHSLASGQFVALNILKMFKIFRAIRALRVLRAIRFMANLQVIMNTVLQSMHSMGAIVGLMLLFMYMFAVIGRGMYAHADPTRFGSLWLALFTLFQLLTLDDWFLIYEDVVTNDPGSGHIIVYLIAYIVIEFLIFLNLFVAVLVDNFQLTLYATHGGDTKENKTIKLDNRDDDDDNTSVFSYGEDDKFYGRDFKNRVLFEEAYPEISEQERETTVHFFQMLASIEYNMFLYQQQQNTFDLIIDLCNEQGLEGDGR
ncbi:cation channel sperm-associated protein 1-like [Watersipora subatra]|uniref:cation channel sperm-associated protein 1-like n=1 Tax=Watersipora subatra TaxID=2589382 RepID=UPI00355AE72B